ncbi:MAG: GHKL domain-containing protein [Acetivibrio ethanolgignens]
MIALEYISHGLKQKYRGYRGTVLFLAGCTAYFFVVTGLNHYTNFEGVLGIGYGVVLYVYCLLAAQGKKSDFFLLSVVWVLLAFISAYVMFALWGIFSGGSLEELLKTESQAHMYFSLSAGALRFSLGRIVLAVYRRRKQKKLLAEDWMMALIFFIFFFLILFMFRLERGGLDQKERYNLSLWILLGIFLVILLLGGFYQLIGKYRIEKIAEEYRKENQKLQEEQIHNLYQLGREANRLRHDMGAKVNVVYEQLRKKDYQEAEENLKRIGDEWEDYLEIPEETGNEGLNAALIRAIHECRGKDIRFHYAVLGSVSGVDSLDMGNLIHNLLKNGIEACDKVQGKRELEIVIRRDGFMVEIEIDNTIQDSVMDWNPSFKTSKIEKEKHGFGMETIRRIVEYYDGDYIAWEEGERLLQRITLKYREIEE